MFLFVLILLNTITARIPRRRAKGSSGPCRNQLGSRRFKGTLEPGSHAANRQDELQPKSGSVRGPFPAELSLRLGNRQIVDACKPALHEAIGGELPILIPVGAIPLAGVVMKLILEMHSDAITSEGPEFLFQSVVEFARPFAPQQFNDGGPAADKLGSVAPLRILRIGKRDALWNTRVPCGFGRLDFLARGFLGERRQGRKGIHAIDCASRVVWAVRDWCATNSERRSFSANWPRSRHEIDGCYLSYSCFLLIQCCFLQPMDRSSHDPCQR